MNWDAIGAIAELAGAVAVVVTLIYFSVQIRQSSSSMHSQRSWAVTQALDSLNMQSINSAEVNGIFLRGCEATDNLDAPDFARFRLYVLSWLNLANYIYHNPTPEHAFFIPYVAGLVKDQPGFGTILDEVKYSLPEDLYRQLKTQPDSQFQMWSET